MDFIVNNWGTILSIIAFFGSIFAGKSFWPYISAGFKTFNIYVSYKTKKPDGFTPQEKQDLGQDVIEMFEGWNSISTKATKKVQKAS